MNWKYYAAVSGATVLAGWIASAPASNAPADAPAARTAARLPSSPPANAPTDIELQAMRLQARLRTESAYSEPARDPFRFAPRRAPTAAAPERPIIDVPPSAPVDLGPAAPTVSLSGIAEDRGDSGTIRTAVLSAPTGILIVREGDEILGYYRVDRIESEAVELVPLGRGTPRRLSLR